MFQKIKQIIAGREEPTGLDQIAAEQAAYYGTTPEKMDKAMYELAKAQETQEHSETENQFDPDLIAKLNKAQLIQNMPEGERREFLRQSIDDMGDITSENQHTIPLRDDIFKTAMAYTTADDLRGLRGELINPTGGEWEPARPAKVLELYNRMIDRESETEPATFTEVSKQGIARKAAHLSGYEQGRIERLQGQAFDITAKARAIQDLEQKATLASLRGYNIEATEAELTSATEAYNKMRQEIRAAREDIRHSIEDRATLADMTSPDMIQDTLQGQQREKALAAYATVQAEREQEQARSRDQGAGWGD